MRIAAVLVAVIVAGCAHQEVTKPKAIAAKPDERAAVVAASIYGYEVNTNRTCPCPYSKDDACKSVSAYDRDRGASPKCYKSDVTPEDLRRWRQLLKAAPEKP